MTQSLISKIARRLERLGDDAENWNYHENAELLRGLAQAVRAGKFANSNTIFIPGHRAGDGEDYVFHYVDGEKVLKYLADNIEVGS